MGLGKLNNAVQPARRILQPDAHRRNCRCIQKLSQLVMPAGLALGALRVGPRRRDISRIGEN